MKFYYENNMGDYGVFQESNLVKAIYTAWNIEAKLYLVNADVEKFKINELDKVSKLIFSPWDDNEFNNDLLEELGYYMVDGEKEREIKEVKTDKVVKYDWSEVVQLV